MPLGHDAVDVVGTTAGYYDLAGADEIRAYWGGRVIETREDIGRYRAAAASNLVKILGT